MNVALITEAARLAAIERLTQLGVNVQAHIDSGYTAHADVTVLNVPFFEGQDKDGDSVTSKTLRIKVSLNGSAVIVDTPLVTA